MPFIIRWPNTVSAGTRCDAPIGIFDLYATAAEINHHELAADEAVDARSFLPALEGKQQPTRPLIHHSFDGRFAIRDGQWKLCRCPGSGGWTLPDHKASDLPPVQLYDLSNDLAEAVNLEADRLEIIHDLTRKLDEIVHAGSSRAGASGSNDALNPEHIFSSEEGWYQVDWQYDLPERYKIDD